MKFEFHHRWNKFDWETQKQAFIPVYSFSGMPAPVEENDPETIGGENQITIFRCFFNVVEISHWMLICAHETLAHESTILLYIDLVCIQLSEEHGVHPEVGDLIYAQLNGTDTSRRFTQKFCSKFCFVIVVHKKMLGWEIFVYIS